MTDGQNDILAKLEARPADALLGLMAAFRADARPEKIDLGVGIYKDEDGQTPVMAAVQSAEKRLAETQTTKAYEGPHGTLAFSEAIAKAIFGPEAAHEDRRTAFATPGGCGALSVGLRFASRAFPNPVVWMSQPTWPNHIGIASGAGLAMRSYPYVGAGSGAVDVGAMLDALGQAKRGDIVILQGACHNPTGVDLSVDDWKNVGALCQRRGLIPLIDIAYHGFGDGLENDMEGVRACLAQLGTALISYSCSKNFGLYRERSGCLIVQCASQRSAQTAASHIADITRALYSMPPAHGPAIVAEILGDAALSKSWRDELDAMRSRVRDLRQRLSRALKAHHRSDAAEAILRQRGMFSLVKMTPEQAERLREEHAIYLPNNGRINVAGLGISQIDKVAAKIASVT